MDERQRIEQLMNEADIVEDEQMDIDKADLIRTQLFSTQIDTLSREIGNRVKVLSRGYFSQPPVLLPVEGGLILDTGKFEMDGGTAIYEGSLSRIDRLLSILIGKDDGSGSYGLPFVGASSIREVTLSNDGSLLYFNPRIDDEFHGKFIKLSRRQMCEARRRMFGTDRAEF